MEEKGDLKRLICGRKSGGKYKSEPRQRPGQKCITGFIVGIVDSHFREVNPLEGNVISSRALRPKM